MKFRSDFVTNSSSSSFIVISPDNNEGVKELERIFEENTYIIGRQGETEFGWQADKLNDVHSKINFAYLQSEYANRDDWKDMLINCILENTSALSVISVISSYRDSEVWAYIDHQSAAPEGGNIEMFESMESLRNFLFSSSSYIQLGNDNC